MEPDLLPDPAPSTPPANPEPERPIAGGHAHRRTLAWLLLAAAITRVGIWVWLRGTAAEVVDERDYITIATNLATRGEFALEPGRPTSLRPPLYPTLVAASFRLFGVGNLEPVRLIQVGMSLVLIGLTYQLAATLYDRRVGLGAAAIIAFYPSLLGANQLILTEVSFTTLLVGGCLAMIRGLQRRSIPEVMLAGFGFGLAALTRSVLWPSFVPFTIWLVWGWRDQGGRRWLAGAAYLLAFLATLTPWSIRNSRLERTFQVVDSMGGRNLMMGNYEYTPTYRAWAAVELPGDRHWFAVLAQAQPASIKATGGQRDKIAMRYGLNYILAHPGMTLRRDLRKFVDFWGLERELIAGAAAGHFGSISWAGLAVLAVVICSAYAVCLASALFGGVVHPPSELAPHLFLILVVALICGAHTVTFGHSRYHLPLIPLLAVYAATALVDFPTVLAQRRRPSFTIALMLCLLVVAGWIWNIVGPDSQRLLQIIHASA